MWSLPVRRVAAHAFCLHILASFAFLTCGTAVAQEAGDATSSEESSLQKVEWILGPETGNIGGHAEIKIPEGYIFTGPKGSQDVLQFLHNPTTGNEMGLLAPDSTSWFVVFEFDPIGFVRDDEKDKLDADKILSSIRKGNEQGNKVRRERGWDEIEIIGWEVPPHYDETTHNLEWAIRGEVRGQPLVNYNTRLLGREGVMEATLLVDPQELSATLPTFVDLLGGFTFKPGKRYSEFRKGDKMAEYGLTALVAGGAGALAVKTGLFAKLGKLLVKLGVLIVVAVGGVIRAVFGRRKTAGS